MTDQELLDLAARCGFDHSGALNTGALDFNPAVRDMCAADRCHSYGKCWTCPPGCGTLEECRARVEHFQEGILVQTVGELEDELDGEAMMETEKLHKEHFREMLDQLRKEYPDMLPLGAGSCCQCKTCTYPDAPCRFPEKQISSMESYGMLVTEVCKANQMEYYHGPGTIAYTSCFLLRQPL